MNNRTMLLLATGAAVVGGVIPGFASPWLARVWAAYRQGRASESFEVRDVEWTRTERPPEGSLGTHVSYDGSGRVVGTGAAAAAAGVAASASACSAGRVELGA